MTWRRRKHSDLLRLLREFAREHPGGTKEWWEQFRSVEISIASQRPGRKDNIISLARWCQLVSVYYGFDAHPALRWLVELYDDRESNKASLFLARFGTGSPDSIARRLALTMKGKDKSGERLPPLKLPREFYAAVSARRHATEHLRWQEVTVGEYLAGYEPPPSQWHWKDDLYHFTFEILPATIDLFKDFPKPPRHVGNGKR